MKNILICGDLIWDTHLARLPWTARDYHQPHSFTQLINRHGGAWYLAEVTEIALKQANLDAKIISPERISDADIEKTSNSRGIAKAFSVWQWFEDAPKTGAWRIKEFLGCQRSSSENAELSIPEKSDHPDVLVIDDLALGFANHEKCWPACLESSALAPDCIVAKAAFPFDRPLWRKLLRAEWASRLTIVLPAAALREAGAQLSRSFSWDRTIEEVQREFSPGGVGWLFKHCRRVVVLFERSGAAVFSRLPRSPEEAANPPSTLQFERFVFDPANLEEAWSKRFLGLTFGDSSVMTASFVCHELMNPQASTHLTVSRGLMAARHLHEVGAGRKGFDICEAEKEAFEQRPAAFQSAFPRELLDEPVLTKPSDMPPPSLLTDALGVSDAFLTLAAEEIVQFGKDRPLRAVPGLSCGKYFTVDREEIERLNAVRNLVLDYREHKADTKPLSLAVFGPPGSGKSFAIKQLSESLFGKDQAVLEFNLSQFETLGDLHEAFQQVRDKSVKGQIPLVFWDEFDTARDSVPLGWLKEFLAPMQDAEFISKGKPHPFGKCIFIFAGGTSAAFDQFIEPMDSASTAEKSPDLAHRQFKQIKGPDFVSRLRGYVNIKGINPSKPSADKVHVIRRGLLLRALIERHHPEIIDPASKELVIDPKVLSALLHVSEYKHGARSMENIISLSRLSSRRYFGPSELPASEVLQIHVSSDFLKRVDESSHYHLGRTDLQELAAMQHDSWCKQKQSLGWVFGKVRDNCANPPTHPLLQPFGVLPEASREMSRRSARLTSLRFGTLGYSISSYDYDRSENLERLDPEAINRLVRSEHRRWMRERLMDGFVWADKTNDPCFLHQDLCKFDRLPHPEDRLDQVIINAVFCFLRQKGLFLTKTRDAQKE